MTGKYNSGVPKGTRLDLPNMRWLAEIVLDEERIAKVRALEPIAKELGCSTPQLALAWCLKNKNVSSVITGASKREQVLENMKALDVKIDSKTMKRIDETLGNAPSQEGG